MALVAGIVPAVYAALKLDEHLPTAMRLAGEYKNLSFSGTSPQRPLQAIRRVRGRTQESPGSIRECQQGGVYSAGVVLQARQGEIRAGH